MITSERRTLNAKREALIPHPQSLCDSAAIPINWTSPQSHGGRRERIPLDISFLQAVLQNRNLVDRLISTPCFEDYVERRFRCPAEVREPRIGHNLTKPRFASLRAECQSDLLRNRCRRTKQC